MAQDPAFPNAGGVSFGEDPVYRLLDDLVAAGVVALASDYQVIQNHLGANMSVDVNPGSAYVSITNGGKRRTRLPAQSNSGTPGTPNAADNWLTTFTAADATNPRIDRVVLTVRDSSVDGSGAYNSALRVIAGTPTAGATLVNLNGAAAVPPNSILLANVLVPNSATTIITANIADVRVKSTIGGNIAIPTVTGYTVLADVTMGTPGATLDSGVFSTSGYTHLRILTNLRDTNAAATCGTLAQLNADTSASYYWSEVYGNNATVLGGSLTSGSTSLRIGTHPGAGATAGFRGVQVIDIPFATVAMMHNMNAMGWNAGNATSANTYLEMLGGIYGNAAAVSRIRFLATTTFDATSRIVVLGY